MRVVVCLWELAKTAGGWVVVWFSNVRESEREREVGRKTDRLDQLGGMVVWVVRWELAGRKFPGPFRLGWIESGDGGKGKITRWWW